MLNSYYLVHPYINSQNFTNHTKANNSMAAANYFYNELSKNFNNTVPEFTFTIQKGSLTGKKYKHFTIHEKKTKDAQVNYVIKEFTSVSKDKLNSFIKQLAYEYSNIFER